jgi:[ribosomal protein S18]-alanine N-acetyltransferase
LHEVVILPPDADTSALARLHAACFAQNWDATALTSLLAGPGTFGFHHQDGFVLARTIGGEAEILTLAVTPAARRRGIGRALLEAAIVKARAMGATVLFLEVGADNLAALALYAGLGFAQVGTRKAYYAGKDAAVLRLSLSADFA